MIFFVFLVSLLGSYSLMPVTVRELLLERSPNFWFGITLVDLCALACGLGVALLFYGVVRIVRALYSYMRERLKPTLHDKLNQLTEYERDVLISLSLGYRHEDYHSGKYALACNHLYALGLTRGEHYDYEPLPEVKVQVKDLIYQHYKKKDGNPQTS